MRATALFALLFAASCAAADSGQLIVDVRTDLRSGSDFVDIRTQVFDAAEAAPEREVVTPAPAARDLSFGFRIAEIQALSEGPKRVHVGLLDAEGALVAERVTRIELVGTAAIVASVTRTCTGVVCPGASDSPEETQCLGGRCVTPECVAGVPEACGEASISLAELFRRSVDASCEMVRECTGPLATTLFKGAPCEEALGRLYDEAVAAPVLQSLGEGRVVYHGERAFGCLNALRTDCRGFALTKQHLECFEAMEGTVPPGEVCTSDFDCAGLLAYCRFDGSCPGVCTARGDEGEPCEGSDSCLPGLGCFAGECAPLVEVGEPCDPELGRCPIDAVCSALGATAHRCVPVDELFSLSLGEPCARRGAALCGEGLVCAGAEGEESCVAAFASGGPCQMAFPDGCPQGEYCDAGSCVSMPGEGEPCVMLGAQRLCASGFTCDALGANCVPWREIGQTCFSDTQCTAGVCAAGECPGPCEG